MNNRKCKRDAKIFGIIGALMFFNVSATYAETVVHTERYHETLRVKANSNAAAKQNKKEVTPRKPIPYTWEQAVEYAKIYPEDIKVHKKGGYKDIYGNFSRMRVLDFLGDDGLANRGNSILGIGNFTKLRVTLNYGQATVERQPFAVILWNFNKLIDYNTSNPSTINIVFESGYVKSISTAKEWYAAYVHPGLVVNTFASDYTGSALLTREEIWDIYQHGKIANVYLDNGGYGGVSFFYSGNKQEEHKAQLTYGFEHLTRLLNINPATLEYERRQRKIYEINEYRSKIRSELKDNIKREILKEKIRNEVQEEVREEIRKENEYLNQG